MRLPMGSMNRLEIYFKCVKIYCIIFFESLNSGIKRLNREIETAFRLHLFR